MIETWLCCDDSAIQAMVAAGPRIMKRPDPVAYKPTGNGVHIVEIRGTLSKYDRYAFGESTMALTDQVNRAAADQRVGTIVLWVDSPGGEVAGTFELANAVQDAAKIKPVIALVDGLAASGAYLVISQATKIYVTTHMDLIGSLAVFMLSFDTSLMMERAGVKVVRIRSGDLKGAGTAGMSLSEDEVAYLQKLVDAQAEGFGSYVAAGRGMKRTAVEPLMTGQMWLATEAAKLGLIDGLSSLSAIVTEAVGPDLRLAKAANQFGALVAKHQASGQVDEEMAVRLARSEGAEVSGDADRFKLLPEWRQKQLLDFLKGK